MGLQFHDARRPGTLGAFLGTVLGLFRRIVLLFGAFVLLFRAFVRPPAFVWRMVQWPAPSALWAGGMP
jgi:hypothetical protein